MDGITRPLFWKASPNKAQIALISKYYPGERNLKQAYLDSAITSTYTAPPVTEFCSLAIQIVQILEQIHEKKVRHGNLRPEIISFWFKSSEMHVCIRDFTESALLGDSGTPASDDSPLQIAEPAVPISHCIHYLAPEALGGARQLRNYCSRVC
jgi:serine/threonine protein kinase